MIIATSTAHIRVNTSGSRTASGILTLIWGACDTSTVAYTIGAGIIRGTLVTIIATNTTHIRVNTNTGTASGVLTQHMSALARIGTCGCVG